MNSFLPNVPPNEPWTKKDTVISVIILSVIAGVGYYLYKYQERMAVTQNTPPEYGTPLAIIIVVAFVAALILSSVMSVYGIPPKRR